MLQTTREEPIFVILLQQHYPALEYDLLHDKAVQLYQECTSADNDKSVIWYEHCKRFLEVRCAEVMNSYSRQVLDVSVTVVEKALSRCVLGVRADDIAEAVKKSMLLLKTET